MESLPEPALIAAAQSGDCEAFGELARRYRAGLWKAARSALGNVDAADDAVQETLLAAYRWLHSYDSRFSFRTWLWTIVLNQCRRSKANFARRRECQASLGDDAALASVPDRSSCPQQAALESEQSALLEIALSQLPEAEADALRMRFFGELKLQEIADVLGCSLGTAKNRIRSGLLRLSERLTGRASTETSTPPLSKTTS
jgi:RNA polymerase sigma-70 factor (ECF subfamily)